ncbi:MAG: hypothetical protein KF752_14120 [Pirellulaceae bacterium]|nr:hypothetical protein [Pirellulaceae bacterium]
MSALRHCSLILVAASLASGCQSNSRQPWDLSQTQYVGSAACITCHQDQGQAHRDSHHALAMQLATPDTVLGDFNDATVQHYGIVSRLYRHNGKYLVHTQGPDGQMQDYEVRFVFGLTPLQQYMVEFPSATTASSGLPATGQSSLPQADELPRIQVLPLCWDTKQNRWFYLNPPDVAERLDPRDDLHWTGIAQRWNNMCADCHSTNFQKNFTPGSFVSLDQHAPTTVNQPTQTMGHYRSTFSEISVGCESCHGPGSLHVELAGRWFPGWNSQRGYGLANLKRSAEDQIQACAPCHSRRTIVAGGFQAGNNFYDHYQDNLLVWPVYYPDGQVLDEDYIHGSFLQSKMYHKGIRCTDCHDPHTAQLKHSGNAVCTSCHQHPAAKYDSPAHHFHAPGSAGAQCVNCHMPTTTYMQVDARHDHSLRIPRPDVSLRINTPNACAGCHLKPENVDPDKRTQLALYQDWLHAARLGDTQVAAEIERANRWCDQACQRWYGERQREPHWGEAIAAGQKRAPEALEPLEKLLKTRGDAAPAIARATALQVLSELDSLAAGRQAVEAVHDAHPLVRSAAANALTGHADAAQAARLLEHALADPVRVVRVEAARNLLEFPDRVRSLHNTSAFQSALKELRTGLLENSDRSGAHLALGTIAEQLGLEIEAIRNYQTAIVVEPATIGPRTNLAALLGRRLEQQPSMPEAQRAELQSQVQQLRAEELQLLARDVGLLDPPPAMLVFRYGLALYLDGQLQAASQQLIRAAELQSDDAMLALSAAEALEKLKNWQQAEQWANEALRRCNASRSTRDESTRTSATVALQRIGQGRQADP